jgi:hypothetical protein
MAAPRTKKLPLRNIREEADLTYDQVADLMSQHIGKPVSPEYVRLLEHRGTRQVKLVQAFARVYGKSVNSMAELAVRPS